MKARILSIIIVAVIASSGLLAQETGRRGGPDFEKYKAMRVAFITEKLDLTTEEAQQFWPVYNEYQDKKDEFRRENGKIAKQFMENIESIDEAGSAELLQKQMDLKKKEMELDMEYHEKFKKVLSAKKIMKLYLAEHHFKSFLLRQIRGERHGGPGSGENREELPF